MQLLRSRKEEKFSFLARKAAKKASEGPPQVQAPSILLPTPGAGSGALAGASPAHPGWSCCRSQRHQGRGSESHGATGMGHGTSWAPCQHGGTATHPPTVGQGVLDVGKELPSIATVTRGAATSPCSHLSDLSAGMQVLNRAMETGGCASTTTKI